MAHAKKTHSKWPLYLIGSSAAVAVWSGWVGLGGMTGFGPVHLLPGIWNSFVLNTAITLPVGVEAYGAYALGTWINPATPKSARKFAKRSAIGSLLLGMLGQIAYHLLAAAHRAVAPWEIVTAVSCLPVVTLGLAAALHHLRGLEDEEPEPAVQVTPGGRVHPVEPVAGFQPDSEPKPMPDLQKLMDPMIKEYHTASPVWETPRPAANVARSAPWEDPTWVQPVPPQPTFTPTPGQVTVRSPLGRAEKKVPVDARVAARLTGSFPAINDTGTFPSIQE